MEHTIHAQPGYPFTLALRVAYSLADDGLSVSTTATSIGADACPYGAGRTPTSPWGHLLDRLVLEHQAAGC